MTTSARELVGWTEQRWAVVQEATDRALARTAKCRQVVPMGTAQIGEKAVAVPSIAAGAPLSYGPDTIASPVRIFVDVHLSDRQASDEEAVLRLVEAGAAQLGALEDEEIIQGAPPAPAAGAAAAAAGAPPAPAAAAAAAAVVAGAALMRGTRALLNAGMPRGCISVAPLGVVFAKTTIGPAGKAVGAEPTGPDLMKAIATGVANLETAGRPGACGLLLHNRLLAVLRLAPMPGAAPFIQQVEQLIGSSQIAGTSALDSTLAAGKVCGILFRIEPSAIDIVHTQKPTVTVLGRTAGRTELRIEEEIVVRVMDHTAVHHLEY